MSIHVNPINSCDSPKKRTTEQKENDPKRARTNTNEEAVDLLLHFSKTLFEQMETPAQTETRIEFKAKNSKSNCNSAHKSYNSMSCHLISAHPSEGLAVVGYHCERHNTYTFHKEHMRDHLRIHHKIIEKKAPEEFSKTVIYNNNKWWIYSGNEPRAERKEIERLFKMSHPL